MKWCYFFIVSCALRKNVRPVTKKKSRGDPGSARVISVKAGRSDRKRPDGVVCGFFVNPNVKEDEERMVDLGVLEREVAFYYHESDGDVLWVVRCISGCILRHLSDEERGEAIGYLRFRFPEIARNLSFERIAA